MKIYLQSSSIFSVALSAVAACSSSESPKGDDLLGTAVAEVRLAPKDARCLVLKTVGTSTVSQSFDLAPLTTSVFTLKGLPLGSDTISATAYGVACASVVAATVATYVSDPVTVNVTAAAPVNVSFQMRLNVDAGTGTATVDFPGARGTVTEFLLAATAGPNAIAAGWDGNLWFTENANKIGRITPGGSVVEFAIPTAGAPPLTIGAGPDGNMWFAENGAAKIAHITPTGTIAEFPLAAGSLPRWPAAGPDGNIWFIDSGKVGRMTPATGAVVTFALPGIGASNIVAGSDGNMWFVATEPPLIGKVSMAGTVTTTPLPNEPGMITAGVDGKLYFTEPSPRNIVQWTTSGVSIRFTTGLPLASLMQAITTGPDGNVWFTDSQGAIGRMTPTGVTTLFGVPRSSPGVVSITAGPDGALWFTETGATFSAIGRLAP